MADAPALDLFFADPPTEELAELLHAALDDFEPHAIQDLDASCSWRVFFRTPADRDAAAAAVAAACGRWLEGTAAVEIADEDWVRRSQAQLTAVRIGRIVVSPPWDPAASRTDDATTVVVIEPSTGFGTGHHATTRLSLELLQQLQLEGRCVIDVGTGSGVLAIAAARLGARRILAIDRDPDALRNAEENIRRNHLAGAVETSERDLRTLSGWTADVVVANLTAAALRAHAAVLVDATASGGTLIISGFAPDDLGGIEEKLGVRAARTLTSEGWAAALFTVRPRET